VRRRAALGSDDGAAIVEFVFLAIVLMVPMVYLVLTLARVQADAFAAEAAVRDASRAAVVGGIDALRDGTSGMQAERLARERADAVLGVTLTDFHVAPSDVDVELTCSGGPCLAPGTAVVVAVTIRAHLPGIASLVPAATARVSATGSSPVDGYAG
jgi:Flp pilus assembly protein TadG